MPFLKPKQKFNMPVVFYFKILRIKIFIQSNKFYFQHLTVISKIIFVRKNLFVL